MKLLLVAHHFPPMGGAGVQRALKFARYLGDFGVAVTVLAGDDPDYLQDPSLLAELPASVVVHRVRHRTLLSRGLAWRRQRARPTGGSAAAAMPATAPAGGRVDTRWRDAALAAWQALQWPDDRGGWARAAWPVGRALLRGGGFDMVMSTAPPVATHALARRLARDAGLPWVADWRDLWADNPGYAVPGWRRVIDRAAEARWLRDAAGVVTVTPSWRNRFDVALGARCPVAWIPNGYDEADFAGLPLPSAPTDGVFRLVHVGSFYGPRDPSPVLEALDRCLTAGSGTQALRLRLVGAVGQRFDAALAAFEARHPGVIERVPYVPHAQALAEMQAADALLLMVGAGNGRAGTRDVVAGMLPGKLFEYLRSNRPMLLLGDPDGDAATLMRAHGRGWVADETDPAAIAQAMAAMFGPTPAAPDDAQVPRFERRALAGELAVFLRDVQQRFAARQHG